MNLENVTTNKKRSKRREFNDFSKVTDLVKQYKSSQDDQDLLEVIKALEGIINTYTLVLTPGDINQQIYITPYMKKFLGMFFTPDERANPTQASYMQAIARVRWIMRQYTYEDIYSYLLQVLIQSIKTMKIIGTCDCIYYIQLIVKYKLHDLIIKNSKDVSVNIADIHALDSNEDESLEDIFDRLGFNPSDCDYEEKLLTDRFYDDITISVLLKRDDIWKCFGHYEKYLIYLHDGMGLSIKQIKAILKFEPVSNIKERLEDITYKLTLLSKEGA